MICHECVMGGASRPAVAICEFCKVGLCKGHLIELYENPLHFPQYGCHHNRTARPPRGLEPAASPEGEPEPMPAWARALFARDEARR